MKGTIPRFVSKERLASIAFEFFGESVNGNPRYEVYGMHFPYPDGGFGEERYVSWLLFGDKKVVESVYIDKHCRSRADSLGIRIDCARKTRLLSRDETSREFFRYMIEKLHT